jgi:hypothetical protein
MLREAGRSVKLRPIRVLYHGFTLPVSAVYILSTRAHPELNHVKTYETSS